MKKRNYKTFSKDIHSLLRDLDNSFVPNHVYDKKSKFYRTACDLAFAAIMLRECLENDSL